MKKTGILLVALALAFSFSFSSCELFGNLLSVQGKVVNTMADPNADFYKSDKDASLTLVGATITFTDASVANKTYTGIVQSDGTYSVANMPNGTYNVTGAKDFWTFIPIQSFVVSGITLSAPDLLAFPTAEAGNLTVVMTWANKGVDMDIHMVQGTVGSPTTHLYHGVTTKTVTGTGYSASLDRDVTGVKLETSPLVETITLSAIANQTIPGDANYNSAINSTLNNSFRFYINAYSRPSGTTGDSPSVSPARATLHVFQGTSHLGSFYAPFNSAEQTLRVLRVQFDGTASNNYVVYADIESTTAQGTGSDNDTTTVYRGLAAPTVGVPVIAIE